VVGSDKRKRREPVEEFQRHIIMSRLARFSHAGRMPSRRFACNKLWPLLGGGFLQENEEVETRPDA